MADGKPWTTRPYHRRWLMNQADALFSTGGDGLFYCFAVK